MITLEYDSGGITAKERFETDEAAINRAKQLGSKVQRVYETLHGYNGKKYERIPTWYAYFLKTWVN